MWMVLQMQQKLEWVIEKWHRMKMRDGEQWRRAEECEAMWSGGGGLTRGVWTNVWGELRENVSTHSQGDLWDRYWSSQTRRGESPTTSKTTYTHYLSNIIGDDDAVFKTIAWKSTPEAQLMCPNTMLISHSQQPEVHTTHKHTCEPSNRSNKPPKSPVTQLTLIGSHCKSLLMTTGHSLTYGNNAADIQSQLTLPSLPQETRECDARSLNQHCPPSLLFPHWPKLCLLESALRNARNALRNARNTMTCEWPPYCMANSEQNLIQPHPTHVVLYNAYKIP